MAREIEEEGGELQETYQKLVDIVGDDEDFIKQHVLGVAMGSSPEVSDQDYEAALGKRGKESAALVDYTCCYQGYMRENLAAAYGHDDEAVNEEAWLATWKKLHSILFDAEGTLLAEVVLFFDGLVKEKFGKECRAMEKERGPSVSQDTSARTFYIIMEKHLHRAIVGATRDEWTGYQ